MEQGRRAQMGPFDYEFAHLDQEDIERVHALERDLGRRYHREIVLIAYERPKRTGREKPQRAAGSRTNPGKQGAPGRTHQSLGGAERGTTFGYTEVQFDGFPTLADLKSPYDWAGRRSDTDR